MDAIDAMDAMDAMAQVPSGDDIHSLRTEKIQHFYPFFSSVNHLFR